MSALKRVLILWAILPLGLPAAGVAQEENPDVQSMQKEIESQRKRLEAREKELSKVQPERETGAVPAKPEAEKAKLDIGGAVRFTYVLTDFDDQNRDRSGDLVFDIFRLNVDGSYKNVLLSAEYLGAGNTAQAQSSTNRDWNLRFNVNVGYYF